MRIKFPPKILIAVLVVITFTSAVFSTSVSFESNGYSHLLIWDNSVDSDPMTCNSGLQISLDENCEAILSPDMMLEGSYDDYSEYEVNILNPVGQPIGNVADASMIGRYWLVRVTHVPTGNYCTAHNVTFADYRRPVIVCRDISVDCLSEADNMPAPLATDNCDPAPDVQLISEVYEDNDYCDNDTIVILRDWMAVDQYGNQSPVCTQRISVYRVEIEFPQNITWTCEQYEAYPGIVNPTPLNSVIADENPLESQNDIDVAADTPDMILAATGSGVPTGYTSSLTYCEYNVAYVDDTLALCGGSTMQIIRKWIVIDMCTYGITYSNQTIEIGDSAGPVFGDIDPVVVSANIGALETGNVCRSTGYIPFPNTVDDCSGVVAAQIFTPAGEAVNYEYDENGNLLGGYIPANGVALGTYEEGIIYIAEDACGNESRQFGDLEVIDDISPSTVCESIKAVTLNNTGIATVEAISFDDGSTDNCCLDYFEVRRVENACPDYDEEDDADWWGSSVHFCCEDVGNPVAVEMKAVDCYGNSTTCSVTVNVSDNTAPICEAPNDMQFLCDELPGNIDLTDNVEMNTRFGTPEAEDSCGATIEYLSANDTRNECGVGTITRRFRAVDVNGNSSTVCQQTIIATAVHDYTIHLPNDIITECTLDNTEEVLTVESEGCDLMAVGFEDDTISISGNGSCYKILRIYTILNECELDANLDAQPLERKDVDHDGYAEAWDAHFSQATAPNRGIYEYLQRIEVGDTENPVITYNGEIVFYTGDDCKADVTLPVEVTDNCEVVSLNWSFGIADDDAMVVSETGEGIYTGQVTPGAYEAVYTAEDGCGSVSHLSININVLDTLPPVITGLDSLVLDADENGELILSPEDLLLVGNDNCCEITYDVRIASTTPGSVCTDGAGDTVFDESVAFCCENLNRPIDVELRATDCYGNIAVKSVFVTVNDVTDPECVAPDDVSISCTDVPDDLEDTAVMDALFGTPSATDNCTAHVEHLDVIDGRNECNSGVIRRRFKAVDDNGNESICTQKITVERVHDYTLHLPADQETDCNLSNIIPLTYDIAGCDLGGMTQEDEVIAATGNGCYTVERTYTVTIFCEYDTQNNPPAETLTREDIDGDGLADARDSVFIDSTSPHTGKYIYKQHLIVIDTISPTVSYSGETVFYAANDCKTQVTLPITVEDDCDETNITWTFPSDDDPIAGGGAGFLMTDEEGSGIFSKELTYGNYQLIYHVTDQCGNTTNLIIDFSVEDITPPDALCKSDFIAQLDENGSVSVVASELDNGSTDNCCMGYFEIKRNDTTCDGEDADLDFGSSITFCCDDIGNDVSITLKAFDCHGNSSTCTTTVTVLGVAPQCVAPDDTNVACTDVPADLMDEAAMDALFGAPQATGGCSAQIEYLEVIDGRDDCQSGTITRKFRATDANNQETNCEQIITVNPVHEYTLHLPADQEVGCDLSGVTPVTADIYGCDSENITYEDETIGGSSVGCYTVERTYQIVMDCEVAEPTPAPELLDREDSDGDGIADARDVVFTDATNPHNGIYEYKQHLFVIDTIPPVVTYAGETVFYLGDDCLATVELPITTNDDCGNTTITWTLPDDDDPIANEDGDFRATEEEGTGIFSKDLGFGNYEVMYHVTDDCDNTNNYLISFTITDITPPDTQCKDDFVAYLDENGTIEVFANELDNGSTDNCCLVDFEIKRNDSTCPGQDDDLNFDATVSFCCDDEGSAVAVSLESIDCYGNNSTCETTIMVLDTIAPQCLLPNDTTLRCPNAPADVSDADVMNELFGTAGVTDNCGAEIALLETVDNRGDCGDGSIVRKFRAVDNAGNETFCDQTITVIRWSDYTIQVPPDISIVGCAIPENLMLFVTGTGCEDIDVSSTDTIIAVDNPDGSCIEKHITYTVLNSCEWNGTDDALVLERIDSDEDGSVDGRGVHYIGNSNPGLYSYTQVVSVRDTVAPEVTYLGNGKYCTSETSCNADVLLDIEITDDCSRKFSIDWQLYDDANENGELDAGETMDTGTGIYHDSLAIQEHLGVFYEVADDCGNTTSLNVLFRVYDCISPMIQCADPQTMSVDANGSLVIFPQQFLEPFEDGQITHENCTEPDSLVYKFLYNFALEDSIVFNCDNVGNSYSFQVMVFDNADNFAGCQTEVNVVDTNGGCSGGLLMSGNISTEEDEPVENTTVGIAGNDDSNYYVRTNTDGNYVTNLALGMDYIVTPELNDNTRNRVSTFDLILIRDHILGVNTFDSPYKIIAADANRSGGVTGMDMVEIRRYILWQYNTFPQTNSWRFVPESYRFPNDNNPFENGLPENLTFRNVQDDIRRADFIAIPTGDVGAPSNVLERGGETLDFVVNDEKLTAGENYSVDFFVKDFNANACQFTLKYNDELVDFEELMPNVFKEENFGLSLLERGAITVSWNEDADFDKDQRLFSVVFKAKEMSKLSDVLTINSDFTKAEAYRKNGEIMDVKLAFENELVQDKLALYQNIPNPFSSATVIRFSLPKASEIVLTIMDATGKILVTERGFYEKGINEIKIDRRQLSTSGVLYYRINTPTDSAMKKMILLK